MSGDRDLRIAQSQITALQSRQYALEKMLHDLAAVLANANKGEHMLLDKITYERVNDIMERKLI